MSPVENSINRRALLCGAAGFALSGLGRSASGASAMHDYPLVAAAARLPVLGAGHPATDVWSYNGQVPGPEIRIPVGERVRIAVKNELSEPTTVHWHGIRLPNKMDGVPGLTQAPIMPGETFTYEFTPPDAGTFWYHSHANSLEQIGRGLAGVLIVEETKPVAVDRDIVWMLGDWRFTQEGQIASGFRNAMEAAMAGRVGNTVTLNGVIPAEEPVRPGERVRLRLINCALARIMRLRFEEHRPTIIAIDGQPCEPHEPANGRILLGPAMRVDLLLDMSGEPGGRYRVVDDFYDGLAYWLTHLVYADTGRIRTRPEPIFSLPSNPLSEPDLTAAERHEIALQGGMMGGRPMSGGMGGMMQGMSRGAAWSINGMAMTGDGHAGMPPLMTLQQNRTYALTIQNTTAWWHPMHLHGFSFRVLTRNGTAVPHRQWADTVLLAPRDVVEVAFVADNPGDWMFHCHVTDHQEAGMMTVLRVA